MSYKVYLRKTENDYTNWVLLSDFNVGKDADNFAKKYSLENKVLSKLIVIQYNNMRG